MPSDNTPPRAVLRAPKVARAAGGSASSRLATVVNRRLSAACNDMLRQVLFHDRLLNKEHGCVMLTGIMSQRALAPT